MKIAIEIPYYAYGMRGTSQFGLNLIRTLGKISPNDKFVVFNYFRAEYEKHFNRLAPLKSQNVELVVPRWSNRVVDFAEQTAGYKWVQHRFLEPNQIELFHASGPHPVDSRFPTVHYAHGAPWNLYSIVPLFESLWLPHFLKAGHIMTPSRCVRDFLLKYYPFDPKRVTVVYYGLDHDLFRPVTDKAQLESIQKKYSLPEKFLLCVGPFQFRDNIEHLFYALQRSDKKSFKDVRVVLAGGLEEHGHALVARAAAMGLKGRVHFPGYVPHQDLVTFYSLATALVHPSYFEELGAQLLEASACGAPIVASNSGGIVEAVGDAPAYFSPHQVDELEAALARVLESESLRQQMRGKGIEWSKRFTWDATAKQALEIYKSAAR